MEERVQLAVAEQEVVVVMAAMAELLVMAQKADGEGLYGGIQHAVPLVCV